MPPFSFVLVGSWQGAGAASPAVGARHVFLGQSCTAEDGRAARRARARTRICRPPPRCAGLGGPGLVAGIEDEDERAAMRDHLDREFRKLKAENAGIDHLKIFAVGDYELDPRGLEWSRDLRGRTRQQLNEALAGREIPDGFDDVPLQDLDLHSEEEIEEFNARARFVDPNGNGTWKDPMPESDFDPDADVHFREWGPEADSPIDPEEEDGLRERALAGRYYASEEEERADLMATFAAFDNAAMTNHENEKLRFEDDVPVPQTEEYMRWQRAAEERGGNASLGDSSALSPAKLRTEFDDYEDQCREKSYDQTRANGGLLSVPNQYQTMLECHGGEWTGVLSVFSILDNLSLDDDDVDDGAGQELKAPIVEELNKIKTVLNPGVPQLSLEVRTELCEYGDGALQWTVKTTELAVEASGFSATVLCHPEQPDALSPGRAVFADGSYVAEVKDTTSAGAESDGTEDGEGFLSLSNSMVASLINDSRASEHMSVRGVAEICMMSECGAKRQRNILCSVDGQLTHVVSICEVRGIDAASASECHKLAKTYASVDAMLGMWGGKGVSLHPYFPPLAVSEMTSELNAFAMDRPPKPQDLTYLKEEVNSEEGALSTIDESVPPSRQQREKLSKRVIAAIARDAERISRCRFVTTEVLQGIMREVSAWEGRASALRSPRLGPWAPDYFALAVPGGSVLIAPLGNWEPRVRSRVELVQATRPARRRLIAARSSEGCVTGAALLCEELAS